LERWITISLGVLGGLMFAVSTVLMLYPRGPLSPPNHVQSITPPLPTATIGTPSFIVTPAPFPPTEEPEEAEESEDSPRSPEATRGPAASPGPASGPAGAPRAVQVADAGEFGLMVRREPVVGERIAVWPNGTSLVDFGVERLADGRAWRQVRDPAGNVGWAAAEFLRPR